MYIWYQWLGTKKSSHLRARLFERRCDVLLFVKLKLFKFSAKSYLNVPDVLRHFWAMR